MISIISRKEINREIYFSFSLDYEMQAIFNRTSVMIDRSNLSHDQLNVYILIYDKSKSSMRSPSTVIKLFANLFLELSKHIHANNIQEPQSVFILFCSLLFVIS